MKSLISVIIPVYNGEKYIDTCLKSVTAQTYKNLDIIVVDDGSVDRTKEICKHHAGNDDRISVISKSNGGVSSARNMGLENAKGEYICFLDADDFLEPKFIEVLAKGFEIENCSISGCNIFNTDAGKDTATDHKLSVYTVEKAFYEMCRNKTVYPYIWNKMFVASVIKDNKLTFDTSLIYGEDTLFLLQYYACVYNGNFAYADKSKLYHHVINADSVMMKRKRNGFSPKWFDQITALEIAEKNAESKGLSSFAKAISIRKCYVYSAVMNLFVISGYKGKEYKELLEKMRGELPAFLQSDLFDDRTKRQVKICAKSPKMKYYLLRFKLI